MNASLVQSVDWVALGPTLAVALGSLGILLADLWVPAGRRAVLRWPTLGVIGLAGALLVAQTGQERGTFCTDTGGGLLACSFVVEPITWALQAISLVGAAVVTMLPTRDQGTPGSGASGRLAGEYHFLLLASLAGAMAIAAARDVLTLVVALEVLSLPAFAMIALPTGQSREQKSAAEGALKAFLVSVVSLAVMLLGAALLYGVTGTLHLDLLATRLVAGATSIPVAAVGATLLLAGLLFKVAAVPFHGWVPDAYVGAPIRVAAFLSVVSKSGGFAGLLVVLWFGLRPYGEAWGTVLAIVAALTMTIGNLGALRQTDVVRLLAWSSIAQSGFMLVPLAAAGVATTARGVDLDGAAATIAYLAVYAVMNLGAFAVVAAIDVRRESGARSVEDYAGLVRTNPLAGIALAFFLISLAGLPPGVAGLMTKVVVFRSAVEAGLGWLAVVMAVNVVIGLAYYLRWTAVIFTRPGAVPGSPVERPTGVRARATAPVVTIAVALAAAVALSVWPQTVLAVL
jgi:NADH-quinone oxidoreductase subunit N